jgi:two-component system response regulator HydG
MRLLQAHPWPGNVRELFSVLESAAIRAEEGARIEAQHLPPEIRGGQRDGTSDIPIDVHRYTMDGSRDAERETIIAALEEVNGNRTKAARILGMGRTTLWRKLKEYGIHIQIDS